MKKNNFYEFLEENLKDPEFKEAYELEKDRAKLAYKIYQLRKRSQLTQLELAKRLHTKQSVIARIENGNQNLSFAMLQKIAHVFNKKIDVNFI
jgi:DNA-binding XRE family transcriptional regulator